MLRNPHTGRAIKYGGPTHQRLVQQVGYRRQYGGYRRQYGGDQNFKLWWDEVNNAIGMHDEGDDIRDQFFGDVLKSASGKPVSKNAFTVAHAMWHGDGNILPQIFDSDESQLKAINESFGTDFPSVAAFIEDYYNQGYEVPPSIREHELAKMAEEEEGPLTEEELAMQEKFDNVMSFLQEGRPYNEVMDKMKELLNAAGNPHLFYPGKIQKGGSRRTRYY